MEEHKNVFEAVLAAQNEAKAVEKDAENRHDGYSYASVEAIVKDVRPVLIKHGIIVLTTGSQYVQDGQQPYMSCKYKVLHVPTSTDFECDHDLPVSPPRANQVNKGAAASKTSNLGYFLRDLLLLPRIDHDIDSESMTPSSQPQAAPKPAAQRPPSPQPQVQAPPSGDPVQGVIQAVNVLKEGTNDNGPWKLSVIKMDNGLELKTFSATTTDIASERIGQPVTIEWSYGKEYKGKKDLMAKKIHAQGSGDGTSDHMYADDEVPF